MQNGRGPRELVLLLRLEVTAMFDLSFSKFLAPKLARWLYVASICWAAIVLLGLGGCALASALDAQTELNALVVTGSPLPELSSATLRRNLSVLALVASPLPALVTVMVGRLVAEVVVAFFAATEALTRTQGR